MTADQAEPTTSPTVHTVAGGDGVALHVREWGHPDRPPILLIHGWSQSLLCWRHQVGSELANQFRLVAMDNRGHGMSGRPSDAAQYQDAGLWAADVAAVMNQLELARPVLVGWSYGGFIVSDYLRAYGDSSVAAINFAGAGVLLNERFDNIGPGFLDHAPGMCDPDLSRNIEATRRFLRACTAEPMDEEDWDAALCYNMVVPAETRAALVSRTIDSDDVLSGLTVPVLVSHGRLDTLTLPSMAEHILQVCPTAVASWYDRAAHSPFIEDWERFNRELGDLAGKANQ